MKNQLTYLFILLFVSVGCQKELIDQRIDECVGATFYYLDNQSSRSFSIEFVGSVLNSQIDKATVITRQQRILIGQDADFGSNPHPAGTFSGFALYTMVDGVKTVIYRQAPVQTGLWVKRKHSPTDPDFGCQKVDYILTVTDELLK